MNSSKGSKGFVAISALSIAAGLVAWSLFRNKKATEDKGNNLFYFGQ